MTVASTLYDRIRLNDTSTRRPSDGKRHVPSLMRRTKVISNGRRARHKIVATFNLNTHCIDLEVKWIIQVQINHASRDAYFTPPFERTNYLIERTELVKVIQ